MATTITRRGLTRRSGLAWLGSLVLTPTALAAPVAPALRLAREARPDIDPRGWLVSEKYDGARALWDGEVLRFRSGLPVAAPAWFLARLPATALDGELWAGRGGFERLCATVRKARPVDSEWQALRYMVFDLPGAGGPFVQRAARLQRTVQAAAWAP
ncbi:MAG: DNA ligase, partial [Rubrivivax sp.]